MVETSDVLADDALLDLHVASELSLVTSAHGTDDATETAQRAPLSGHLVANEICRDILQAAFTGIERLQHAQRVAGAGAFEVVPQRVVLVMSQNERGVDSVAYMQFRMKYGRADVFSTPSCPKNKLAIFKTKVEQTENVNK